MNKKILLLSCLVLAALLNTAAASLSPGNSAPVPKAGETSVDEAVAYVLTHYHYSREPLDATLAGKIFDEYLKELDPSHSYFLQPDIDSFATYRSTLGTSIEAGDLKPAFAIYAVFRQRFDSRMVYAQSLLDTQPDLQQDESL